MKRYLINALSNQRTANRWFSGLYNYCLERNPGDMVYNYAIMNALSTDEDVEFIPTGFYNFTGYDDAQIEEINQTCGAFIVSVSDIFAVEWKPRLLPRLTELIRKLKIPCIVPYAGLRCGFDPAKPTAQSFDKEAREFVDAVLDHSAVFGVRGATTGEYLKYLGYAPEKHFQVVGCASISTYGANLPDMTPPKQISKLAFNLNIRSSEHIWKFIADEAFKHEEHFFVSQDYHEFLHFFLTDKTVWNSLLDANPCYRDVLIRVASENRLKFFMNRRPWSQFLSEMDFLLGVRIHGAILSILSGTPTVIIPFENRTRELAEYHGLPIIYPEDIHGNKPFSHYLEKLDFSLLQKRQNEVFPRYIDFLHRNGLATVFDSGRQFERDDFPLERLMPKVYPDDNMCTYDAASRIERFKRRMAWKLIQRKNSFSSAKVRKIWGDNRRNDYIADSAKR